MFLFVDIKNIKNYLVSYFLPWSVKEHFVSSLPQLSVATVKMNISLSPKSVNSAPRFFCVFFNFFLHFFNKYFPAHITRKRAPVEKNRRHARDASARGSAPLCIFCEDRLSVSASRQPSDFFHSDRFRVRGSEFLYTCKFSIKKTQKAHWWFLRLCELKDIFIFYKRKMW